MTHFKPFPSPALQMYLKRDHRREKIVGTDGEKLNDLLVNVKVSKSGSYSKSINPTHRQRCRRRGGRRQPWHGSPMLYLILWDECESGGGKRAFLSWIPDQGTTSRTMDSSYNTTFRQTRNFQSRPEIYEGLFSSL